MWPLVQVLVYLLMSSHGIHGQEEEEKEYDYILEIDPEEDADDVVDKRVEETKPKLTCPKDCTCTQEGVVDCAGVDLKEFPVDLPEFTNHLSLQNNQIQEIPPEDLIRLYKLETLNLQNNRLASRGIPDDLFEQLESLSYLYLANNKLTLAPRFLPSSLISADFAANYITKIYDMTFGHKPNLRSVYLHNNKLTDAGLPGNMFNSSDNVEILIMSSNFLKYVPQNLPPALYKLHLKNNKLEKIPPGAFSHLSDLRELYLQNNLITNEGMDNETFTKLNKLEYLDLSSNNLMHIPSGLPRNIVILHLEKNNIRSISNDVLTQIRNLEYLLLHNNKLRARGIHPDAFSGLKKLHTVHMYNNMLEKVPAGLPRRVKTLMLLHNQISSISKNDFATTYFLEDLNLSYNKIMSSTVHRDAFRKLRLLKTLELSGNSLKSVPHGLPKNLEILKLKENEISTIPHDTLAGMTKLKELYLSNNKLKINSIYTGAWAELSSLQLLDLSGNQLSYVPPDLPESLEYLYLQNNRIVTVSDNAFESTPNIKRIFLRFNLLTPGTVKETAFHGLDKLQVLDIESHLSLRKVTKKKEMEKEREEEEEEEYRKR
ncbi:podocan [Spea bombifrons]|uniref:podocan n=1 Tax=Spea bombifrons TaxID=233779 RepID=UPI002349293E|nr:podocan [Spea bombifrons]XP_053324925.1 podocan [Spea bombifrons]XP_053324926.1 podocan [Spea bombifrons]